MCIPVLGVGREVVEEGVQKACVASCVLWCAVLWVGRGGGVRQRGKGGAAKKGPNWMEKG